MAIPKEEVSKESLHQLEKRFLNSISTEDEDEKSLSEFNELIENPYIVKTIALMPQEASALRAQSSDVIAENLFLAMPLYVAITRGSAYKLECILTILDLPVNDGSNGLYGVGLDTFARKLSDLECEGIKFGDGGINGRLFVQAALKQALASLPKVSATELQEPENPIRQKVVQLLGRGLDVAEIFSEWYTKHVHSSIQCYMGFLLAAYEDAKEIMEEKLAAAELERTELVVAFHQNQRRREITPEDEAAIKRPQRRIQKAP